MQVFWNSYSARHAPQFFLQRGQVRAHYEIPARAEALLAACQASGLPIAIAAPADLASLQAVHDAAYLAFLADGYSAWRALADAGPEMVPNIHPSPEMIALRPTPPASMIGKLGWFTADLACPIGPDTWLAARAGAGVALAAAAHLAQHRSAYALTRPPGHHSYRGRAGGHCYLNNAAIAAEALRRQGAARVAILDIDSHHGNGTQDIFYARGDIFFASVHGDPSGYYPWYVGHADERGIGPGEGKNLNLPLRLGSGDAEWLQAIGMALAAIGKFQPDALVVSLGFDASRDEPLAALQVTEDGFARAGELVGALHLPTAIIQEGGYNVAVMGTLLSRFLAGFSTH